MNEPCTKTVTTFDANGAGQGDNGADKTTDTLDEDFRPDTEESKALICAYAIENDWLLADREQQCPEPTVTEDTSNFEYDASAGTCYTSKETEYHDGRPDNVVFEITAITPTPDNQPCCTAG